MRRLWLLGFFLLLPACNGDDGGTGSSQVFPGTYRGPASVTVTAGGASRTATGTITITVSPGGTVSVGTLPPVPLDGNHFATGVPFTAFNTGGGLTCTQGGFGVDGTFVGTTVTGAITSAGLQCNGAAVVITGGYSATLQPAELRRGHPETELLDVVRDAIRRVLP